MSSKEHKSFTPKEYVRTGNLPGEPQISPFRLGVLISGTGSNLQALIDAIENQQLPGIEIALVVSNKADVMASDCARRRMGFPLRLRGCWQRRSSQAELRILAVHGSCACLVESATRQDANGSLRGTFSRPAAPQSVGL